MAYQKYLSIPNRRGNVGDRDHFQHIENALKDVVPGPGEVIVGGADGPVAVSRALMPPAPMTTRLLPYPEVMATPPDFTHGETNLFGATTPNVPATHAGIRVFRSTTGMENGYLRSVGVASGRIPFAVDFMFDGDKLAFELFPQRTQVRVRVDGELVTEGFVQVALSSMAKSYVNLDFGTRAHRHILIELNDLGMLRGLYTDPKDTVWQPDAPLGPRVVVMGASWSAGNTGIVLHSETFPYVMGDALGWKDIRSTSIGGSGYLHTQPYRERMQTDIVNQQPDIVLVTGSGNDSSYAEEAIRTEAGLLYDEIREQLPKALLIVAEPFFRSGVPTPEITKVRSAIHDAAAARGLPYIETADWITGEGQTNSPTASGNGNYYITSNHPNQAGSAYLGRRFATAIAAMSDTLVLP